METSRRAFVGGVAGLALAAPQAARAAVEPAAPAKLQPALDAIQAYARAHQAWMHLPALTLSVTMPDGWSTVMNFGLARPEMRAPVTPETLFQIGSISKSFVAAAIHQMAAEGKLALDADIRTLLPEAPWPEKVPIAVQQVLDHVSGLPEGAPAFLPAGRLWLGYKPGEHWSYSNLGYLYLGLLAEKIDGKPLDRILRDRLLRPLGMMHSKGAIVSPDRLAYAQGYEPANYDRPYLPGAPLMPAAWSDQTSGAGCVASTAADMALYLRSLASAAAGKGGLGLSPEQGRGYATHAVKAGGPAPRYGNGLMHVTDDDRDYLHHTGGMVMFSSSFHLDPESGIGAFASSSINYAANYRPRLLTLFAVKSLRAATAGQPLPAPPPLVPPVKNAANYAGRYSAFEVRPGPQLTIDADGRTAALLQIDDDVFATDHPRFADWAFRFERADKKVVGAGWGRESFVREGSGWIPPASDPALAQLAGHYVNDSPWLGVIDAVERGGKLWLAGVEPLTPIGTDLYRVGPDEWSPERARFANPIDGRPQTLLLSSQPFDRRDV